MASTEIKFSVQEICRIIEVCKKKGVASLKVGPLEIEMIPLKQLPGSALRTSNSKAVNEKVVLTPGHEELLRESMQSQLLIDDPVEYEKSQLALFT